MVEDNTIRIFSFNHISYITLLNDNYLYPADFSVAEFLDSVSILAEEGIPPTDDREGYIHSRLEDKLYHYSSVGGFILDEEVK